MKPIRLLVAGLVLLVCTVGSFAQNQTPPTFCCSAYHSFGDAKYHAHVGSNMKFHYGFFRDNGLVLDPENNAGNDFFGNTIHVGQWGPINKVFWYDWSEDLDAATKLAVWKSNGPFYDPLTLYYDQECMMVVSISSPQFP